jgi:hypothetical protein
MEKLRDIPVVNVSVRPIKAHTSSISITKAVIASALNQIVVCADNKK